MALVRPREKKFDWPQPKEHYPPSQRSGVFIGLSGVGKTTTAIAMLQGSYKDVYSRVYVFSPGWGQSPQAVFSWISKLFQGAWGRSPSYAFLNQWKLSPAARLPGNWRHLEHLDFLECFRYLGRLGSSLSWGDRSPGCVLWNRWKSFRGAGLRKSKIFRILGILRIFSIFRIFGRGWETPHVGGRGRRVCFWKSVEIISRGPSSTKFKIFRIFRIFRRLGEARRRPRLGGEVPRL